MPIADLSLPQALPEPRALGETSRRDAWWVQPLLVFLGFSAFVVYATWAGVQGVNYFAPGTRYLAPMHSPVLWDAWQIAPRASGHAWFGPWPSWLPHWVWFIPLTPAALIAWIPAGFRVTCYYYRGAYYKAFWADPLNCAVGEPRRRGERYRGEAKWPLLFQNIHRYFLYGALVFIGILSWDAIQSYFFPVTGADGVERTRFGIGVGSLVMTVNPIMLAGYALGCHSLRHLIGGVFDQLSRHPIRKRAYDCASCFNRRHMLWAWMSLFWVGFTDFYVRMVAMGYWHDFRLL